MGLRETGVKKRAVRLCIYVAKNYITEYMGVERQRQTATGTESSQALGGRYYLFQETKLDLVTKDDMKVYG